jgi:small subunit ribosomal protein S9
VIEDEQREEPAGTPETGAEDAPTTPAASGEEPAAAETPGAATAGGEPEPAAGVPAPEAADELATPEAASGPVPAEVEGTDDPAGDEEEAPAPRSKPEIPGADLEIDIVPEGVDALAHEEDEEGQPASAAEEGEDADARPIASAAIDLAAGARYRATGKRKTAVARVVLRPGAGEYRINGRPLDVFFPRATLQRNIRQPLETVGYETRMDVVATLHGGGVSAQAGALRHGISRALIEADPNLRGDLKRRGFLTRDARAKERKKAGLKKARKRPQFSKR